MFPLAFVVALLSGMLWCNTETLAEEIFCQDARTKCVLRSGCRKALENYIYACSSVLRDNSGCPEDCQHALIALTSTNEGHKLMTCECKDDEMCKDAKNKVEVCRPHVTRALNEPVMSCNLAHYICAADNECSEALFHYNRFCKSMFHGKKCPYRCKNAINILRRQEKAAKLDTCVCNGREDYNCSGIRTNMARLCFHKEPEPDVESNELAPRQARESGSSLISPTPLLSLIISWRLLVT